MPSKVKAAEGYVEVTVTNEKLNAGLRQAESSVQKFGKKLDGMSMAVGAGLTAAFLALGASVSRAMGNLLSYGDKLDKMSQRLGVSVESLRQLDVIAKYCGTSLEGVESNITKMNNAIGEAITGSQQAADKFSKLGLSIADLQSLNPDEAFKTVLSSLSKVNSQSQRTALAIDIFGKSASSLFPLINSGSKGIEEMENKLKELGITMSEDDADKLASLTDSMTSFKQSLFQLTQNLLIGITPALTALSDTLSKVLGWLNNLSPETKKFIGVVGSMVGVFAAATAGMVAWNLAAGKLAAGIKIVNVALRALSANPWVLGITVAISAIMGLVAVFKKHKKEAEDMVAKAEEITSKHQQQADADNALMSELQDLNSKQNKNSQEMARASELCSKLNEKYGDLGLSVNRATGEIEGLTDAQKKMNDAQKQMRIADVKEELRALEAQDKDPEGEAAKRRGHIADLQKQDAGNRKRGYALIGDPTETRKKLEEREQAEKEWQEKIQSRRDYLAALESGTDTPSTSSTATPTATDNKYAQAFDRGVDLSKQAENIGKKAYELDREKAEEAYQNAVKDAETVKQGDLAYGASEEEANQRYQQTIEAADKIRQEALRKANEAEQQELERAQKEKEDADKEAAERAQKLAESNQKESEKAYQDGLQNLEELRQKYSQAMNDGKYGDAEAYGKQYEAQKEELELAKSNAELESANQELIVAIDRLREAEENGTDDEKISAREKYQEAQSNVNSARDSQTSAQRAIYERQKQEREEAERLQKELAEKQTEQAKKQEEYNKILSQDINANLQTSYKARGSFSGWEAMGGGVSYEEKQLKEAERANKWNEKIFRELQEFNQKDLSPTYA